jgi:hypothetical protein
MNREAQHQAAVCPARSVWAVFSLFYDMSVTGFMPYADSIVNRRNNNKEKKKSKVLLSFCLISVAVCDVALS